MRYMLCSEFFFKTMRSFTHKRVYRSGGKGRRPRMKWVLR